MISLSIRNTIINGSVTLPISKSIFNRQLIIHAIMGYPMDEDMGVLPDDCQVLLESLHAEDGKMNIGHAGTAMRFLTAYSCLVAGEVVIRGSHRMHHRPIHILVDALRKLGADIQYLEKEGCPPLKIGKGVIQGGQVSLSGGVSSQYISALLLIAPALELGLKLEILPPIVSQPYVDMTISMMKRHDIDIQYEGNHISIDPQKYGKSLFELEFDWSAVAFWYELVAMSPRSSLLLKGLKRQSLQGDSVLPGIFESMGVETRFVEEGMRIMHTGETIDNLQFNCIHNPDLALPIAATCAGLKMKCTLLGLETLLIKESNRVLAFQKEMKKFGIAVRITSNSLSFDSKGLHAPIETILTYDDHRIAMSMAPLAVLVDGVKIDNESVVTKSYPQYWQMMEAFFKIK